MGLVWRQRKKHTSRKQPQPGQCLVFAGLGQNKEERKHDPGPGSLTGGQKATPAAVQGKQRKKNFFLFFSFRTPYPPIKQPPFIPPSFTLTSAHPRPNSFVLFTVHCTTGLPTIHSLLPLTTACRLITSASCSIGWAQNWNSKHRPQSSQPPLPPPPSPSPFLARLHLDHHHLPSAHRASRPASSQLALDWAAVISSFISLLTGWTNCFSLFSSIFIITTPQLRQPNMPPRRQAAAPAAAAASSDEALQRSTPITKLLTDHDFADVFQGKVSYLNTAFECAPIIPSLAISEPQNGM